MLKVRILLSAKKIAETAKFSVKQVKAPHASQQR
jgi:hypothetical protein